MSGLNIFYGDEGNDKFEKFVNTGDPDATIIINGGAGDDKISGAANFESIDLYGGEGNDVVYGGEADN